MLGFRTRLGLLALGSVAALAAPSGAWGATTVGQAAPSSIDTYGCGGPSLFISPAVAPGTPSYEVPTDGVLTSWSVRGGTAGSATLKLKLMRPTGANTWEVVSEDPTPRTIPTTVLSTFGVRLPVSAGQFLAVWAPDAAGDPCSFTTAAVADVLTYRAGANTEPTVGQTYETNASSAAFRTNVSAVVEADCDNDGLGDETQDTDTASCNPPPLPDTDPPEARITKHPPNKTEKHKVKFKFRSDEPNSTFECKKDKKPFKPCSSPTKMKHLDGGKHKFKVRAIDPAGNVGPADKDKFKVVESVPREAKLVGQAD